MLVCLHMAKENCHLVNLVDDIAVERDKLSTSTKHKHRSPSHWCSRLPLEVPALQQLKKTSAEATKSTDSVGNFTKLYKTTLW